MKAWRKVHSVIVSSERLASSTFEARWLYTLLLVAQDDEGRFPWTRTMVRSLTATTDWTYAEATAFKNELTEHGLLTDDGQFAVIRRGKELNGTMRTDREPFVYPEDASDTPLTYQRLTTDDPRATGEDGDKTETETRQDGDGDGEGGLGGDGADAPTHSDPEVWPEWYSLLYGVEGFKASYGASEKWRAAHDISDELVLSKAYALRDWWPRQPPARRRDGNPYATWQNWCREEKRQAEAGPSPPARASPNGRGPYHGYATEEAYRESLRQGARQWNDDDDT